MDNIYRMNEARINATQSTIDFQLVTLLANHAAQVDQSDHPTPDASDLAMLSFCGLYLPLSCRYVPHQRCAISLSSHVAHGFEGGNPVVIRRILCGTANNLVTK